MGLRIKNINMSTCLGIGKALSGLKKDKNIIKILHKVASLVHSAASESIVNGSSQSGF